MYPFKLETSNQCFLSLLYQLLGPAILFWVYSLIKKYYHINGLHLFWDSFEWFTCQITSDSKYFFLSYPRNCDRGLIVVRVYYFRIWSKKADNTLLAVNGSRVNWDTLYIFIYIYIYIYIYMYKHTKIIRKIQIPVNFKPHYHTYIHKKISETNTHTHTHTNEK